MEGANAALVNGGSNKHQEGSNGTDQNRACSSESGSYQQGFYHWHVCRRSIKKLPASCTAFFAYGSTSATVPADYTHSRRKNRRFKMRCEVDLIITGQDRDSITPTPVYLRMLSTSHIIRISRKGNPRMARFLSRSPMNLSRLEVGVSS
jgi:hypothetical protein